jgi:hypothetical protein
MVWYRNFDTGVDAKKLLTWFAEMRAWANKDPGKALLMEFITARVLDAMDDLKALETF